MKDKIKYGIITFLFILLIIFYVVLFNLNLFLGVVILGGILSIVPIVMAIYVVYRVIKKTKSIAFDNPNSNMKSYFNKSECVFFLLLVLSFIFISINLFISITIIYGHISEFNPLIMPLFIIQACMYSSCISCGISASLSRFFNRKIIPKRTDVMKFSSFIRNREKIPILELQEYFQGDKLFYDKLLTWVDQFKFKIDGDLVILNSETVDDFIHMIDTQYKKWTYKEKSKKQNKIK